MNINIVYFSRSGKTRRSAEKLSKMINAEIYEVTDSKNWKGIFGYIKAGYYASTDKKVEIKYDPKCLEAGQLIIMSPLWAGGPSSAMRTFIRENSSQKMILILTNDGTDINKAFERVKVNFPNIQGQYGITKAKRNESEILNLIKDDLNK